MSDTENENICQFGSKPTSAHKSWVFTLNNYTPQEWNFLTNLEVTRSALGKEVGDSGTSHIQGLLVFQRAYRFTGIKKLLPRAHIERCKSIMHAWNYCIKDGNFHITDNRRQGQRNETTDYRDAIKSGHNDRYLCDNHPVCFLKFSRTQAMRQAYQNPRTEMTKCVILYGQTGTGKSSYCKLTFPDADWIEYDGRFFSTYTNQKVVIFDDQDLSKFTPELIKRLINHTPMKIRVLGAYAEWNPELVVFTTNYLPSWLDDPAIKRRVKIQHTEKDKFTYEIFDTFDNKINL